MAITVISAKTFSKAPATPSKRMKLNSPAGSPRSLSAAAEKSEEDIDSEAIKKMLVQIKCLNICRNVLEHSEEVHA